MMGIKTKALLLSSIPVRESDLIVVFFTEKLGKTRALAKGALRSKKRFLGILLELNELLIELELSKSQEFPFRLQVADLIKSRWRISKEPAKLAGASVLAEIIESSMQELVPDEELYSILNLAIEQILASKNFYPYFFNSLFRIFSHLGLKPSLYICVNCERRISDREKNFYFDIARGGLICEKCADSSRRKIPLDKSLVKSLRALDRFPISKAERIKFLTADLKTALEIFQQFSAWHLPRPVKSFEVLKALIFEKTN